jgi:hypothetical protein
MIGLMDFIKTNIPNHNSNNNSVRLGLIGN